MKIIIVFYSRTGTTKKLAMKLEDEFNFCDVDEIVCSEIKPGFFGFIKAGHHTLAKKKTEISPVKFDPAGYDLVVIGTPVWAGTVSSPVRTYLSANKDKFKKVAFFCTCSSKQENTFETMEQLCAKEPVAKLELIGKTMDEETLKRIQEFSRLIRAKIS